MATTNDTAMVQPNSRQSSQTEIPPNPATMSRSTSSNSTREARLRPKSRGSTTSLQSVGVGNAFQPSQQHNIHMEQHAPYVQHGHAHMQAMFPHQRQEEENLQYQQQFAHLQQQQQHQQQQYQQQQMIDHAAMPYNIRPMSQQAYQHDIQHYPMQYPNGMPQYQAPHAHMQHIRHQSEHYEGSPAPEDSNNENAGAKRRKGAASSMANDAELKRLLEQNGSKSLKEIATDVQKNEGAGGKSEKAKQVFAMLWLRENCQKSTNSVRRDRVFARYTERCGNERVPTLNPASFGKLVRIIFPNVQTRRLGVRGESKYHYVDLSLVPEDEQQQNQQANFEPRPSTAGSLGTQRPALLTTISKTSLQLDDMASANSAPVHASIETADFPAPASTLRPPVQNRHTEHFQAPEVKKMDCRYLNTPTIRIPTTNMSNNLINYLPAVRANLPATMATYLAMPSETLLSQPDMSTQDTPIELPNIHDYLEGTKYDYQIAKLLQDLYRSYCIDVIDAFRKCKDKSFFSHHSAFNGKMTVPVSKVFNMECVAPWIQECDMRMYKQIVRFLAPLAQQVVPEGVWRNLNRISTKLVSHLVAAFEEKCPVYVVAAKVVPAARFTSLLKKLQGANSAALKVNQYLEHAEHRTQMWLDLMVHLKPEELLDDSTPPPECLDNVKGILKHDFRNLLRPEDDSEHLVMQADHDPDSAYAVFMSDPCKVPGVLPTEESESNLLKHWIQWLEKLSTAFEGHHPQCMLDWHSRLWRSIMSQLLTSDAISYSAWLGLESFATQMLAYMTQMEGFLLHGEHHKLLESKESDKKEEDREIQQQRVLKRKREDKDVGGEDRSGNQQNTTIAAPHTSTFSAFSSPALDHTNAADESDADMHELSHAGPLELPTFRTGMSSPMKPNPAHVMQPESDQVDDSGIGLGLEDQMDHEGLVVEREAKRFNKRDWLLSSDPADPGLSSLGVIV